MPKALLVCLVVLLAACSVRYGPRVPGFVPGYVDQQLGDSTYQVKIGEAWPKDWPDLEKFALYRAAEMTKSTGKRFFTVLNASTKISNYTIDTPSTTTTTGTAFVVGSTAHINATSTTTGGSSSTISGGWYILDFKVIDESEVNSFDDVVDAEAVISDLRYFIDSRR
jgi:hypothetical protein